MKFDNSVQNILSIFYILISIFSDFFTQMFSSNYNIVTTYFALIIMKNPDVVV